MFVSSSPSFLVTTFALLGAGLLAAGPSAAGSVVYPKRTPVSFSSTTEGDARFLVRCGHSHFANDDPIVSPGQPGAAHQHEFFGSTTTNASSTVQSLLDGPNTCGVTDDDSAYWFPSLREGDRAVAATNVRVYYLSPTAADPSPFPEGFRVIAGSAASTGPQDAVRFDCGAGGGRRATTGIPRCPGGTLRVTLRFPDCSDGRLDSADHKLHMAYSSRGVCPASHSITLPKLLTEVSYPTRGAAAVAFSSGGQGSFHGDFMNGWHPATLRLLLDRCLVADLTCGIVRDSR